jgi:hypothetical protein
MGKAIQRGGGREGDRERREERERRQGEGLSCFGMQTWPVFLSFGVMMCLSIYMMVVEMHTWSPDSECVITINVVIIIVVMCLNVEYASHGALPHSWLSIFFTHFQSALDSPRSQPTCPERHFAGDFPVMRN